MKRIVLYACSLMIIFSSLMPLRAMAYDEGFFAANDILFYNPDDCVAATGGSTDTGGGLVSGGNSAQAWCYLLSHGISKNGAAGILGNMMRESSVTPNRWQEYPAGVCDVKSSPHCGYGLVQWTSPGYKNVGSDTLWKFAGEQFPDTSGKVGTLQTQLDYLMHTLEKSHAGLLATLKKPDPTVEKQAFNFYKGYEMPGGTEGDALDTIGKQNALTAYSQHHNLPCGTLTAPVAATPSATPAATASPATTSGGQTVVIVDPGHANSTPHKDSPDPAGLIDINSANTPEMKNMFDVAKLVQTKLNSDGYKALLTKDTNNSVPTSYERAKFADSNNGDIALSIHTYSGFPGSGFGSYGEIYPQKVGEFRTTTTGTDVKFTNADTATKSQAYAKKFKAARSVNENGVIIKDNSFDGRLGIAPGNLAIVQLISNVPWVYNEADAMTGDIGLSSSDKQKYADGLIKGVEDSIGPNEHQGGSSTSSDGCTGTTGGGGASSVVEWALKLAWDDVSHGGTPRPEYVPIFHKYFPGSTDYTACNQFVATIMRISGADTQYSTGVTNYQEKAYILKHPEKYTRLDNPQTTGDLMPGDIFFDNNADPNVLNDPSGGHTYIYVGENQKGGNKRQASYHSMAPSAGNVSFTPASSDRRVSVYRLK